MEVRFYALQNACKELTVHRLQIKIIHMNYSVGCFTSIKVDNEGQG